MMKEQDLYLGIVAVNYTTGDISTPNTILEKKIGVEENYIFRRTGIQNRFYLSAEQSFLNLALSSVNKLLAETEIKPEDISVIICASTTFDKNSPSLACEILNQIDPAANNLDCFALDINAACSGYVYGLDVVKNQLLSTYTEAKKNYALLVTNEAFSHFLGNSPTSDIIFGDASSATLIELSAHVQKNWKATIHNSQIGSVRDRKNSIVLFNEYGCNKMLMNGLSVYENAVKTMTYSVNKLLSVNNLSVSDITMFIPHQANSKIIEAISRSLGVAKEHFYCNIKEFGNTGASSIPICLTEIFYSEHKQVPYTKGMLTSFGAGFAYGSMLIEFI